MKELLKQFPHVSEINEVVNVYEVFVNGLEPVLKVKIVKHLISGSYMGVANLEVKPKNGLQFTRSLHTKATPEEALADAIAGFFQHYDKDAHVREVKGW